MKDCNISLLFPGRCNLSQHSNCITIRKLQVNYVMRINIFEVLITCGVEPLVHFLNEMMKTFPLCHGSVAGTPQLQNLVLTLEQILTNTWGKTRLCEVKSGVLFLGLNSDTVRRQLIIYHLNMPWIRCFLTVRLQCWLTWKINCQGLQLPGPTLYCSPEQMTWQYKHNKTLSLS